MPLPIQGHLHVHSPSIRVGSVVYNMSLILCFLEVTLEYICAIGVEKNQGDHQLKKCIDIFINPPGPIVVSKC